MEPRLWILIQAFAHLLPPGDVIDAGANDGADSSRFARLFGQRTVLAIEPTIASTRHIMKTYVERQGQHNIEVLRAGLGEAEGSANYSALLDHRVGAQVGDYEPGPAAASTATSAFRCSPSTDSLRIASSHSRTGTSRAGRTRCSLGPSSHSAVTAPPS